MADIREVITAAIPCNIVYGRHQAADEIIEAIHAAGFRILGPDELEDVRRLVQIANRNEWSAEGEMLARTLAHSLEAGHHD